MNPAKQVAYRNFQKQLQKVEQLSKDPSKKVPLSKAENLLLRDFRTLQQLHPPTTFDNIVYAEGKIYTCPQAYKWHIFLKTYYHIVAKYDHNNMIPTYKCPLHEGIMFHFANLSLRDYYTPDTRMEVYRQIKPYIKKNTNIVLLNGEPGYHKYFILNVEVQGNKMVVNEHMRHIANLGDFHLSNAKRFWDSKGLDPREDRIQFDREYPSYGAAINSLKKIQFIRTDRLR